jgi:dynein heavy chain 1
LVNSLFVPASFDVDFKLVSNVEDGPVMPDGGTREQCMEWIGSLPSRTPPTWIGLDSTAEVEREKRMAESVIEKVSVVQEKCETIG